MEIRYLSKTKDFIRTLDPMLKNQAVTIIEMLGELGYTLKMPFSKSLGKGLFELRIVGDVHMRIFYCFNGGAIYLLSGIKKKTQKTPIKEIENARRMQKLLAKI